MSIFYIDLVNNYKNRFDLAKFMEFENDSFDILTSYFIHELRKLPPAGNITVTYEIANPELISFNKYGDPQYDWILMEYNNLTDINEIVSGLTLYYPSLSSLEALYFRLKAMQVAKDRTQEESNSTVFVLNNDLLPENTGDKHFIWEFTNEVIVVVDHPLNKRASVSFVATDDEGNEVEEGISVIYPVGLQTSRVIVNFGTTRSGKLILN